MLKKLTGLLFDSTVGLLDQCQKRVIDLVTIEAASRYLKLVQGVRRQALILTGVLFCVLCLAVAVVVMPVVLILWVPLSASVKLLVLCMLAVLDIGLPLAIALRFFSEKRWLKFSRSSELISKAVDKGLNGSES